MIEWRKEVKNCFMGNDFRFSYFRGKKRCENIFCFDVESTSFFIHPDGTIHNFNKDLPMSFMKSVGKGGLFTSGCYL